MRGTVVVLAMLGTWFAVASPGSAASVRGLSAVLQTAPLKSGYAVGESLVPFDVRDVTGPNKGKQLCYI